MSRLLTEIPATSLAGVHLAPAVRTTMLEVVREHCLRHRLQEHGLRPRNRLFFCGPPGCGKTMTARALAGELGMRAYVVRYDSLVASHLGETSRHVREVFEFSAYNECVVLLDEIDAVGRKRGSRDDVGEVDRIVISLMQGFDLLKPAGLFIAASNVPDDIDPALVRRFDLAVEFPQPERKALMEYMASIAATRGVPPEFVTIADPRARLVSFADAERLIIGEQRRLILEE